MSARWPVQKLYLGHDGAIQYQRFDYRDGQYAYPVGVDYGRIKIVAIEGEYALWKKLPGTYFGGIGRPQNYSNVWYALVRFEDNGPYPAHSFAWPVEAYEPGRFAKSCVEHLTDMLHELSGTGPYWRWDRVQTANADTDRALQMGAGC